MQQTALFAELQSYNLDTQGIKYAGSKAKLLPYIVEIANKVGAKKVLDGFSGSTRVSQALAKNGFQVTSNDAAIWSKVFASCFLLNKQNCSYYTSIIEHLNSLKPVEGWFSENYGGTEIHSDAADFHKKPWQLKNTMKLDAIREEIDKMSLCEQDKCVALTSLILALDKVDSTLGHYVSYLKNWSPRSYNDLKLEIPQIFINEQQNLVLNQDIFEAIKNDVYDLAYFDPPYGSNNEKMPPSRVRYAAYYHIWKTVCLNDKPQLFGQAGRRLDSSDRLCNSVFEDFRKSDSGRFVVIEAIEKLLQSTKANFIVLSYSSGGRATAAELHEIINNSGKLLDLIEVDFKKNVMASMKWTNQWTEEAAKPHKEFLFLIEKK